MSRNLSKHRGSHSSTMLQGTLRNSEAKRRLLTALRAEEFDGEKFTIGEHDGAQKPKSRLTLVLLGEDGSGSAPAGQAIQFKGTAWIENTKRNVAITRESEAATAQSPVVSGQADEAEPAQADAGGGGDATPELDDGGQEG